MPLTQAQKAALVKEAQDAVSAAQNTLTQAQESLAAANALTPDAPPPPPPPPPPPSPTDWRFLAMQNQVASVPPNSVVRYGANDKYNYKIMSGQFIVSDSLFGDPILGATKHADLWIGTGAPPIPIPTTPPPSEEEPNPVGFTGIRRVLQDAENGPRTPPAGKLLAPELNLHGYGADYGGWGDVYNGDCGPNFGGNDHAKQIWSVVNVQQRGGRLEVRASDPRRLPNGVPGTFWIGWKHNAADATEPVRPFTERRLDAILTHTRSKFPYVDWDLGCISGTSMGGTGAMSFGLYRPYIFKQINAYSPSWTAMGVPIWPHTYAFWNVGPKHCQLEGNGDYATHYNMIEYVRNPANEIPFVLFAYAVDDSTPEMSRTGQLPAIKALRDAGRGFACVWNAGGHSAAGATADKYGTYHNMEMFRNGYPVLSESSLDDDPATTNVGGINLGFEWRNVLERGDSFSCELRNVRGNCTVKVTPKSKVYAGRSTKAVTLVKDQWQAISFTAANPDVPPPTNESPTVEFKTVNTSRSIVVTGYYDGERYDRFQHQRVLAGAGVKLSCQTRDFASGGSIPPFGFAGPLTLTFDGKAVATTNVTADQNTATFNVDLTQIAEGHYFTDVTGAPAPWTTLGYAVYVLKGTTAKPQSTIPLIEGSYGMLHPHGGGAPRHARTRVPAVYRPVEQPLAVREYPDYPSVPRKADLVCFQLSPVRDDDLYRPCVTAQGVWTTANNQRYGFWEYESAVPRISLLDGPRGRGCVVCPTGLREGRNGKVYFVDPWRFGVVTAEGEVRTLAGYRHKAPPSYWNGAQDLELVGDWSAIPVAERGFHELWDMAWDARTLTTDPNASPIGGDQPHVTGPVAFVTDTQRHRVCKLEFSPTVRDAPPRVTKFATTNRPWGCEFYNGQLWVTESGIHSVTVFDATTGAVVRRVQGILRPEGIRYQDGFMYVGSLPSRKVWKIDVSTFALSEHFTANVFDGNSRFVNLAISDGTFGPRGMIALMHWSNNGLGHPHLYSPAGALIPIDFGAKSPLGPYWPTFSYGTAVSIGGGRMTFGTVLEGLCRASKSLPTDKALSPLYAQGKREYMERGYHLTHGREGFGFFGLAQPWNVTPAIDAYLLDHGHTKG